MTDEPVANDKAFEDWLKDHREAFEKASKSAWKADEEDHEVMGF
jgi:hypothetical protein